MKPDLAIRAREHLTCEFIFDAACLCLQVNDVILEVKHMLFVANYGAVLPPYPFDRRRFHSFVFDRGCGVALGQHAFSVLATYDYLKKH
jgi:hypothetical protein